MRNASGYCGDDPGALPRPVRGGALDHVRLDFLAEITMVVLQRQRTRDPGLGYAYDFVSMLAPLLPEIVARGARVVANAGGVNVEACRDRIADACRAQSLIPGIGMVSGDDLMPRLDEILAGASLANLERYELPGLRALNFVLRDALGGGGTLSLRTDHQGKTLAQALLALERTCRSRFWRDRTGRGGLRRLPRDGRPRRWIP